MDYAPQYSFEICLIILLENNTDSYDVINKIYSLKFIYSLKSLLYQMHCWSHSRGGYSVLHSGNYNVRTSDICPVKLLQ